MRVLCLLLILGLGGTALGASDDHHVEQVRSPHVSAFDLGTHMTSGHLTPPSGDARRGQAASTVTSPGLTSTSNFATFGSSSGGYGARGSFSAYSPGYSTGSGGHYDSQSSEYQSQAADYGAQSGYQSHSSSHGAGSSAYGSQHAEFGVSGYPAGGYRTHRREMEMEEHYENGRLVSGREEEKEWKDDDLLRHERRHYGEA